MPANLAVTCTTAASPECNTPDGRHRERTEVDHPAQ
jgi:hypothetical protein